RSGGDGSGAASRLRQGYGGSAVASREGGKGGPYVLFDERVTLWASASPFSFTFCSHRLAQAYSRPRMPSPIGITTIAGPGSTIIAMPTTSTVNPTTEIAMRLASRYATLSIGDRWDLRK